ncbi:hypothetical protein UP36_24385 [Salmonella enterica subsp. enterica]|nr:hypothetical protein [Salmonella enterica subsp. enterica]
MYYAWHQYRCHVNEGRVEYDNTNSDRIMGIHKNNATGNYEPSYNILTGLTDWNLSLSAAPVMDKRVFAVASGTTLNLGNVQGDGAHLILRTDDRTDNGHSNLAAVR